MPEGVEALVGLFLPCGGEGEGDHRRCAWRVPEGALDAPGGDASCEQMGSVGLSEGMEGPPCVRDAGALFGLTAGTLDTGAPHGRKCWRTLLLIAPGRGKEPRRVTMGCPGGAEPHEGVFGPGDVPVLGALAAVAMDLEALPVHVRDLQEAGFMKPEAQALDGREGDVVVHGGADVRRRLPSSTLRTAGSRWVVCARRSASVDQARCKTC